MELSSGAQDQQWEHRGQKESQGVLSLSSCPKHVQLEQIAKRLPSWV